MDEFVTLENVSAGDIFPNFRHLVLKALSPKKECSYFLGNCNGYEQNLVSSNSVCNQARD